MRRRDPGGSRTGAGGMTHVPDLGATRRTLALAAAGLAGALALASSAGAQGLGSGQVSTTTIQEPCRIGAGGPVLYRNVGAHHTCALHGAPVGSIFMIVDETGDGVDLTLADRSARLTAPEPKASTCGRGSMVFLAVIATATAPEDGAPRSVYDAVCMPGAFRAPAGEGRRPALALRRGVRARRLRRPGRVGPGRIRRPGAGVPGPECEPEANEGPQ